MYQGKHMKRQKKPAALLASLVLVVGIVVAGTIAFLVTSAGPVVNTFTPTNVPPEIHEEFDGKVKSNVRIENQGTTDAYIRAAVMVNWVDASGNVLGQVPELDTDYAISYNLSADGWVLGDDGYYYWTQVVSPKDTDNSTDKEFTGILITAAEVKSEAPLDRYELAIDIMAQTIQTKGMGKNEQNVDTPPVTLAWGVAVNADGTLAVR